MKKIMKDFNNMHGENSRIQDEFDLVTKLLVSAHFIRILKCFHANKIEGQTLKGTTQGVVLFI
jgi:hypothetical protein